MVDFSEFAKTGSAKANNRGRSTSADFVPSEHWANIGVFVNLPSEDGGTERVFISLGRGIPLDDLDEEAIRTKNPRWRQILKIRNSMLRKLKEASENLEAGTSQDVTGLSVQISRANSSNVSEEEFDEADDMTANITFG